MAHAFPRLDHPSLAGTRDVLHAYARVLGGWLTSCRSPRKHWWQGSLKPSLKGVTTGVVYAGPDFELELNLLDSQCHARIAGGPESTVALQGQPAGALGQHIEQFLLSNGLEARLVPDAAGEPDDDAPPGPYSPECAEAIAGAWRAMSAMFEEFQAGIREESSVVQLWPHHFDLAMMWLPGTKVPGQDPGNADYADKQMGFGFTLGDDSIPEPYFYITAYPLPDTFPSLPLPPGTTWHTAGFQGAVVRYQFLADSLDPGAYLLDLCQQMLKQGGVEMGQ